MASSRADVLLAENERLNAQRLQLLRDLRTHAQTLGNKSVLHFGLSAAQVRHSHSFFSFSFIFSFFFFGSLRTTTCSYDVVGFVSNTWFTNLLSFPSMVRAAAAAVKMLPYSLMDASLYYLRCYHD